MPATLTRVARLLDALFFGVILSVGAAVIVMVLVISYGVVAREVFKLSDVWITDLTTYLMGYMTFVGSAALSWRGRHVKIDAVGHLFSPMVRQGMALAAAIAMTCVSLALLWLTSGFWSDAWDSDERSWGMLSMPLWIPYLSLVVGSALMTAGHAVRLALLLHVGKEQAMPADTRAGGH
jgi:TRAP-type C4-dicarboxylate transport system permease small subunit